MNFFCKFRSLPAAAKASMGSFMGSIVSKGLVYFTTPIFTRLLTSEEYGQTTVYYTWCHILGIFAMFCLSYGVFNNGMVEYPEKRDDYSFSMLVLSNVITIAFAILIITTYPFTKELLNIPFHLVILMCMMFICQPAYDFWLARQRYEFKYKMPLFWTVFLAVVSSAISIGCILIFNDDKTDARIFGQDVPLIVIYLGFVWYLGRRISFKLDTQYWKFAFKFNLPLIPHYMSGIVLGSSDRIMIANIVGESSAAYYTIAYTVGVAATLVWTAINSSLIPYTYEKCKMKDYESISNVTNVLLLLFAGVTILTSLCAPELVLIMATAEYLEAIYIIPAVICGVFFQILYFIFANIVYYHKKPVYLMYASVFAALLNIVLNLLLIPRFGYFVAAYTTLFCYLLQAVLDYLAMKKVVNSSVYNMRFVMLLSISVTTLSFISELLYNYVIVRYVLIILIISFAFVYREQLNRLRVTFQKKK